MNIDDLKSEVVLHITDDAVSWISDNWRFYISNDDNKPYWGFVHKNGELELETDFLSDEAIKKIVKLLEAK